jgi:hypothetical protein
VLTVGETTDDELGVVAVFGEVEHAAISVERAKPAPTATRRVVVNALDDMVGFLPLC